MMATAPDPKTLTEFSAKALGEIKRDQLAAHSGGLVNLSAGTFWEMYYAAVAWHEYAKAPPAVIVVPGPVDTDGLDLKPSTLIAVDKWQPSFDAHSLEQERLVREFCFEIAGALDKPGSPPDPVRLLEMAQALYEAERA